MFANLFKKIKIKKSIGKATEPVQAPSSQITPSLNRFMDLWNADLDSIWALDNHIDFICAMNGWLCRKSEKHGGIDHLTEEERIAYIVIQTQSEINNGGFAQFLYNSSGDFADKVVPAMQAIGAEKTAAICERALSVFGRDIPLDWQQREQFLNDNLTDEMGALLEQYDSEFFQEPDNLDELTYYYIHAHRDCFIDN